MGQAVTVSLTEELPDGCPAAEFLAQQSEAVPAPSPALGQSPSGCDMRLPVV